MSNALPSFMEPAFLVYCLASGVGVLVSLLVLMKWWLSASLTGRPGWLLGLHRVPEFET